MVGKFSTSRSPTSSAWSSMSIQRNSTLGNFSRSARNPGRYSTQVSHHSAHKHETTTVMADFMHALAGMAGLIALAWLASEARRTVPWRAVAAGIALELVLVISALSALLFYWRVLPAVVRAISWLLRRTMGVGGVVGLATAANVFVGMVEAPLFVRPYLARVSRGELFALMVPGMASIAGTVLFLYASILGPVLPEAVAHLLIASILSAPAALAISFVMVPPKGEATGGELELRSEASGAMDAITRGTLDGAQLLVNIIAMLVVFVALVALVNLIIAPYSLQGMLGAVLAPLAWLCGVPWAEAPSAGALLGTKTVLNELIAYIDLTKAGLSEKSRVLMTYALCGFANFGSLGIMIGGLGTMCPERRGEVVALGMKSIVAGTLATCFTAASVALIF